VPNSLKQASCSSNGEAGGGSSLAARPKSTSGNSCGSMTKASQNRRSLAKLIPAFPQVFSGKFHRESRQQAGFFQVAQMSTAS
jgi:hypothetical protein